MVDTATTARPPREPRGMVLQPRDIDIFETIHAFDGMLTDTQIQELFFNKGQSDGRRACRYRLSKLWQNRYINKPNRNQRSRLPQMVYWLAPDGAQHVATRHGIEFRHFQWVKRPRWGQIPHDIAVGDFRVNVMCAVQRLSFLELGDWYSEGVFRRWRDRVKFSVFLNSQEQSHQQIVTPDGYFEIFIGVKKFRLLVEIDMANKDNPRLVDEKARPYLAYIKSETYYERFGHNSGRVLFITTSQRRLQYMKNHFEKTLGRSAEVFLFTTFDQVNEETVLTEPIWYQGGEEQPSPLFVR